MKRYSLTESVELHPISSCTSDKIGNSELRDILKEYYGNNDISYTADYDSEIWGEVMSYLERDCKLIKEIELVSGIVTIYETVVLEKDKKGCPRRSSQFLYQLSINIIYII